MNSSIPRLNEVFTEWYNPEPIIPSNLPAPGNRGIFSYIQLYGGIPLTSEGKQLFDNDTVAELNRVYHGGRSGFKRVAPFVQSMTNSANFPGGVIDWKVMGQTAGRLYGKKWISLFNTFLLEYNPIENYRMEESGEDSTKRTADTSKELGTTLTETYDRHDTKEGGETKTLGTTITETHVLNLHSHVADDLTPTKKTYTDQTQRKGQDTKTQSGGYTDTVTGNDTDVSVFGFNSSSAVPSSKTENDSTTKRTFDNFTEITSPGVTETVTHTESEATKESRTVDTENFDEGTITHAGTGADTNKTNDKLDMTGTVTHANTGKDTEHTDDDSTTKHNLTRSGNIGVTTSQQMIQSEREIWLWDFYEVVFSDLDRLLTLPIY